MRSSMHHRAGFTLVELMIVIIILGILAAIAIPGFANASGEAGVASTATDIRSFERATHMYALDRKGDLPLSNSEYQAGIATYLAPGATDGTPGIGGNWGFHVWDSTEHAAIGVWGTPTPELRVEVDARIDDGVLDSGLCRQGPGNGILHLVYGDAKIFSWP